MKAALNNLNYDLKTNQINFILSNDGRDRARRARYNNCKNALQRLNGDRASELVFTPPLRDPSTHHSFVTEESKSEPGRDWGCFQHFCSRLAHHAPNHQ